MSHAPLNTSRALCLGTLLCLAPLWAVAAPEATAPSSPAVQSAEAAALLPQFADPAQEARYRALIDEFRCPKCQNNNLSGSDAPIAQDLRQKTAAMIQAGQTDGQIREYMVARYGDFISYRPPLRPSTWILWAMPPLLLVLVLLGWAWRVRRQSAEAAPVQTALSPEEQARLQAVLEAKQENKP